MVEYICEKCNKKFKHKGDYDRHINKKRSCVDESLNSKINTLIKKLEDISKDNETLKKDNKILKDEIKQFNNKNMKKEIKDLQKEMTELRNICINGISNKFPSANNDNENKPKKKKKITHLMKRLVWDAHIGNNVGKAKCLCCKDTDLTQLSFTCGHVISEANGGELTIENLLPICQHCNSSMYTLNMREFKVSHGLT
jgi:5-methylcytosine-specific restriction endonuclease McrA